MGRAMMAAPKLLMLDEPSMGFSPDDQADLRQVTEIQQQGTTMLLVEQNPAQALEAGHRGYMLEAGKIVPTAPAPELASDPAARAYLGGED